MSSGGIFDLDTREERLRNLDQMMSDPGFWDDQEVFMEGVIEFIHDVQGGTFP